MNYFEYKGTTIAMVPAKNGCNFCHFYRKTKCTADFTVLPYCGDLYDDNTDHIFIEIAEDNE